MRSAMDDLVRCDTIRCLMYCKAGAYTPDSSQGLSADQVGQSSIFSSDEEIFAFARAVSRLSEMGTQAWSQSIYYA